MTGSQSARWVLRATLGKSSDRGEPECFRPARTLREAPERGRLLLREPNAAKGSALARPVTVRSAGRGPGAARSAEPLRQFERIGEVRCYSRLNMGRHQVERIEKKPASPRWGWSGVHEIVPPSWAEAELGAVAVLLPSRQSSIENIGR